MGHPGIIQGWLPSIGGMAVSATRLSVSLSGALPVGGQHLQLFLPSGYLL
jgi:hypothetical protein